jgi:hypothetical protein
LRALPRWRRMGPQGDPQCRRPGPILQRPTIAQCAAEIWHAKPCPVR